MHDTEIILFGIGIMTTMLGALLTIIWTSLGKRLDKINGTISQLQGIATAHGERLTRGEEKQDGVAAALGLEQSHHDKVDDKILQKLELITRKLSALSAHCVQTHGKKIGEE